MNQIRLAGVIVPIFLLVFGSMYGQTKGKSDNQQPKATGMKNAFVIEKSIKIHGTPEQVWDALTNGNKTKQYFYNSEVISDWKIGSPITFKSELDGKKIELKGEIIAADPGKLLMYRLDHQSEQKSENARGYSIVTDRISFSNGVTELSISDDTGSEEGYKKSVKGWDAILDGLKKLVEAENK